MSVRASNPVTGGQPSALNKVRNGSKGSGGVKLPACKPGQAPDPSHPCTPKKTRLKGGDKRKTFRVPLKKEDGNMEAQIIEYNAETPNRVVIRLEYLMQTTKVRLNDRHYMDDFYAKLLEEETRCLNRVTKAREQAEQNRMKKLIIDGLMTDIPLELSYLHRHPVFRVNQMLARLKRFETTMVSDMSENDEIIPIEPYEYNGNEFFRQLHDGGILWVPSEQKMIEDEKLEGKIQRAKLRLIQKRKEEEAEAKVLRLLNATIDAGVTADGEIIEVPLDAEEEAEADEDEEDEMLNSALRIEKPLTKALSKRENLADKVKEKAKTEAVRLQEKIKRSKLQDVEREARLDLLRQRCEKDYLDSTDYEKFAIIDKYAERVKKRNVSEIFQRPDYSGPEKKVKKPGNRLKPYELLYAKEPEDFNDAEDSRASKYEDSLFRKMRHIYDISKNHPFKQYEEYCDELILDNVDNAQRIPSSQYIIPNGIQFQFKQQCDELMDVGEDIVFMYERQQLTADDHVNKRVDMNALDEDDNVDKTNRMSSSSSKKGGGLVKLETVEEEDEDEEE
ncbi:unnamed protein product [Orchesella dallaii]|uniref:Uncharacterized protein n=1 Tax=Orchesella dallaii TaxID=48710 RepID=A0ABP1Q410_9HEXA